VGHFFTHEQHSRHAFLIHWNWRCPMSAYLLEQYHESAPNWLIACPTIHFWLTKKPAKSQTDSPYNHNELSYNINDRNLAYACYSKTMHRRIALSACMPTTLSHDYHSLYIIGN
jgi:hypothetical protein